MLIEDIKNINSGKKELRQFGLLVGGVFLVLGLFFLYFGSDAYPYLLIIGGLLVVLGLVAPKALLPLHKIWMTLAVILGWFMTRLILLLLFYVVLTPMGLTARLLGKHFLDLKRDKTKDSYWEYRAKKKFKPEDLERQF